MLVSAIGIFINTFILSYSARYMDIYDASFGQIFIIALVHGIFGTFFGSSFGRFGWIAVAAVLVVLVKYMLAVSWSRAIMVYIVMTIVSIMLGVVLGVFLIGCACM